MSLSDDMRKRWLSLFPEGRRAFVDIAARYSMPSRHYHNLNHIRTVLDVVEPYTKYNPGLWLAAWLHDVIYDPKASDNEEQSAEYARHLLPPLRCTLGLIQETARLILLTKAHETTADDLSGRLLLDADLSILGSDAAEYDAYAAAIRREYAWVPEAEYRAGRARVLERFLARPAIYQTHIVQPREEAARANLQRELAALA